MDPANAKASRFEQLTPPTKEFISDVAAVTQAEVSMVVTGFGDDVIIDRRQWGGRGKV